MNFSSEREYLHELANHLTIIQGAVKKVLRNIDEKQMVLLKKKSD